ncbi:TolC family protein [Pollutibacter soli]|uniref:TolC family protein n=1 Tax=Pollutibacter soli TaxID=3034157 RepID=UPI00301329E7
MKRSLLFISLIISVGVSAQDSLLTAQQVLDMAIQNNLRVQIARADIDIAKINNNWGNAGRWPVITAGISNTEAFTNINQKLTNGNEIVSKGATNNILSANLSVNWRLYNGMRVVATKERFKELEKIGEIAFRQEVTQLSYDVLIVYYNLVRLHQQVQATSGIIALSEERFKIAETRFNVGSAAKTDMLQAEIDLNAQKIVLENLQQQIRQTKIILNNLLKREPEQPVDAADTAVLIQPISLKDYTARADTQNFQLLLAQRDRAVLLQDRRIINAQRLPVLSLTSVTNYNRNVASAGFFLTNLTYGPNIGIGLAVPIFNSNIVKTQLRVNEVQLKQQQLQTDLLRTQIQSDLHVAFQEYLTALRVAEVEKKNVDIAEENNFIATERFRKLQSNSIELRQAQLSLTDARDRYINAQYRAKLAATNIQLLAGEVMIY